MRGDPPILRDQGRWFLEPAFLTPGAVGRLRLEAPLRDGEQVAAAHSTWSPGVPDLEAWQVRCEIEGGRLVAEWVVVADLPGQFQLVAPQLVVEDSRGGTRDLLATTLQLEVVSATGDPATARFAELRGPLGPPEFPLQQLVFLVVAVALTCAAVVWWRTRPRQQGPRGAAATDPAAGAVALARLDALERAGPYGVRRRAEVVGEVLRDFLEARFRIPARRRTRQELMARLPEAPAVLMAHRDDVECVLARAEVARFAPERIVLAVTPDAADLARRLIVAACSTLEEGRR